MLFWNSLAFSMIQHMLAIWSLVPLPFLKPSWTSGSSRYTYCWSLAWRILSITLLACAAAAAKSRQSCPTLCDPIDGSPQGSPVPGILQARTLEWVAISSSNAWKWEVKVKLLSRVWLLATPWTAAYQAPPSMGFSRQEYWSGLPLLSPSDSLLVIKVTQPFPHIISLSWETQQPSPISSCPNYTYLSKSIFPQDSCSSLQ